MHKLIAMYVSLQHAVAMQQLPLVSVSRDLETILQSICDMLLFSEIVEMVDNSSDYYTLFQLNTQESCNWVSILHVYMHDTSNS